MLKIGAPLSHRLLPGLIVLLSIAAMTIVSPAPLKATSVDRLALCNLRGVPGKIITEKISLISNDNSTREGTWNTYYRNVHGDGPEMDITSWISIEPREFVLGKGEVKYFTVSIRVPENATPGLWGAASREAGLQGHSAERRTYIYFKDTQQSGNMYTGILIPVSVQVVEKPGFFSLAVFFLKQHWLMAVMLGTIGILLVMLVLLTVRQRGLKAR